MMSRADKREFHGFGIVPAAGRSARMGQPKLLLPWKGTTLMEHVLRQWRASRIDRVIAVAHPEDAKLHALLSNAGAELVIPLAPPPDMKCSVQIALEHLAEFHAPRDTDAWLLAPADLPGISPTVIDALLAAHEPAKPAILRPTCHGQPGHPVLFPWPLSGEVARLAEHAGVNRLLKTNPVKDLELDAPGMLEDIDTPEDYDRLRERD